MVCDLPSAAKLSRAGGRKLVAPPISVGSITLARAAGGRKLVAPPISVGLIAPVRIAGEQELVAPAGANVSRTRAPLIPLRVLNRRGMRPGWSRPNVLRGNPQLNKILILKRDVQHPALFFSSEIGRGLSARLSASSPPHVGSPWFLRCFWRGSGELAESSRRVRGVPRLWCHAECHF